MRHSFRHSDLVDVAVVLANGRYRLLSPHPVAAGTYSIVYHGVDGQSGEQVAIKRLRRGLKGLGFDTEKEILVLKRVQGHSGVVRLVDTFEDSAYCYIVTEWCGGGPLHEYIEKNGPLSEELSRRLFTELVRAVVHCHKCGVINQDLKNENILLTDDLAVRVADFGLCVTVDDGNVNSATCNSGCGSPVFAAPEVYGASFSRIPFNPATAKTWALGVILHSMLTGSLPFSVKHYQRTWMSYKPPEKASAMCKCLLRSMMRHTPSARASVEEIAQNDWLLPWSWEAEEVRPQAPEGEKSVAVFKCQSIGFGDVTFNNAHLKSFVRRNVGTLVSTGY